MARISRMISLNRDNILSVTQTPDFYTRNPLLAPLQPKMDECRAAFYKSGQERGCRCRADGTLLHGCVSEFLELLNNAKETNPEAIQEFIRCVAKADDVTSTGVTIYYAPPDSTDPVRYTFP
jgi:hypothetical protein